MRPCRRHAKLFKPYNCTSAPPFSGLSFGVVVGLSYPGYASPNEQTLIYAVLEEKESLSALPAPPVCMCNTLLASKITCKSVSLVPLTEVCISSSEHTVIPVWDRWRGKGVLCCSVSMRKEMLSCSAYYCHNSNWGRRGSKGVLRRSVNRFGNASKLPLYYCQL